MHGHVCRQKRGALELSVLAGICFVEVPNPHFVPTLLILGGRGRLTLMHLSILCPTTPLLGDIWDEVGHLT